MRKNISPTHVGGPHAPELPPEYLPAILMHQENRLNAGFARKCLGVAVITTTAFLTTLPVIGFLGWQVAHPPVRYFATHNGYILPIRATDTPAYSDTDVIDFGGRVIRKAFTLDFKNYRSQISGMQDAFSADGFRSYYTSLTHSNLFSTVTGKRMLMSPDITRPGVIVRRGQPGGKGPYMWEVQYPVTLSVDGQNSHLPAQTFTFTVRIQQTDVLKKPEGLELDSIITRSVNG
jgi:intracellular multiplication protein IcmL